MTNYSYVPLSFCIFFHCPNFSVQTANAGAPRLPESPKLNGPDIKRSSIIFLQNCISIWCNPQNINHVGSFKDFMVTLLHFQQQVFWWHFNKMMKRLTSCWSVLDFGKINLEKSSLANWIFSLFRTGFLLPL